MGTTCCTLLASGGSGIKINIRKLYQADGHAVRELLKVAQLLYDAQRSITSLDSPDDVEMGDVNFSLNARLTDLQGTRSICSALVESGATLHDLLQKESSNRPEREKALRFADGLARSLDATSEQETVERAVAALLASQNDKVTQLKQSVEELTRDEKALE